MLTTIPRWLQGFLPWASWHLPSAEKVLYLSFDDGPSPGITEKVLQILEEKQAKATFFLIGDKVERHPELVKETARRGHAIGNHSFHHLNGWQTENGRYFENVEMASKSLAKVLGKEPVLFRPPYGRIKPGQWKILRRSHQIVMWEVLAGDFVAKFSQDRVLANVLDAARPGSVIVFHDSEKCAEKMLFALPKVLEHFERLGYRFEAIPAGIISPI